MMKKILKHALHVTYYTDPLCCWSWAMEPAWQQLLGASGGRLTWRYCMGGLLQDWRHYHDAEQQVSRPIQMGPVWLEAKYVSGQPVNEKIWFNDPPASSYPACMAVKCAAMQSPEAEHRYLYALREAAVAKGRNIAKKETLLQVAASLPGVLDVERFRDDLEKGRGLEGFKADLQETGYRNIIRLPTLVLQRPGSAEGVAVTGYRPFDALWRAIQQLLAGSPQTNPA